MTSEATILVVDDEELLRNALVFQFKREGFQVMSASNGKEAFEIIKNHKIDAVVSDVQMPGGNGIDLLKDVKDYNSEIPVLVFITAFADITDAQAYDLGADAIFTKPFDKKQLVKTIKNAILFKGKAWKSEDAETGEHTAFSGTYNISPGRGGVFVQIESPALKVGSVLNFSLETTLNGKKLLLKGTGAVRWVRYDASQGPLGFGLEFIKLESESMVAYEEWLTVNHVKPFIPLN